MTLERVPAAILIAPLSSNADKIRALARAGYLRTEISEALGIRYQQVRRVLVDAGMTEGLQRSVVLERPPVRVAEPRPAPAHGEVLLRAGFDRLGSWVCAGGGEFTLNAKAPAKPGVYAFLLDDLIMYVGLTQAGLSTRMGHYRRGHSRPRTSARVKALIAGALAAGLTVDVLIATPDPQNWNGLPVNTAAGLEAGLIRMLRPPWNMLGAVR